MKTTATVLQVWVRVVGAVMILLGLLIWTGAFDGIIPVHMLLGITLVLALWLLAILGVVARVNLALVALVFVWGLIMPALGLTQTQLVPGSAHVVIQALHLLVGIAAIGLGDTMARQIKRRVTVNALVGKQGAIQ